MSAHLIQYVLFHRFTSTFIMIRYCVLIWCSKMDRKFLTVIVPIFGLTINFGHNYPSQFELAYLLNETLWRPCSFVICWTTYIAIYFFKNTYKFYFLNFWSRGSKKQMRPKIKPSLTRISDVIIQKIFFSNLLKSKEDILVANLVKDWGQLDT